VLNLWFLDSFENLLKLLGPLHVLLYSIPYPFLGQSQILEGLPMDNHLCFRGLRRYFCESSSSEVAWK
jgi:hypothetical protein